jgi:tRNA-splicing ligase RtcB
MPEKLPFQIEKVDEWRWRIPRQGAMRTDGLVFADDRMMEDIKHDQSLLQVSNVATLPGIVGDSMAMPDIHWGYGFPIGGVAAFDLRTGVVSPGGVGYDINCGVRLLRSSLSREDVLEKIHELVAALFNNIPSGVGAHRKDLKLSQGDLAKVLTEGVRWAVGRGFGSPEDLAHIEAGGCIPGADPDRVSSRAMERGRGQLGTVGSGNHFIEVGYVDEVYDPECAQVYGLEKGNVTILIHTGSRGLGHQICDDYIKVMMDASRAYGIELPDPQLCCAPVDSRQGRDYLAAMAGAANFAFVNRQIIDHWTRESFEQVFGLGPKDLGIALVYDVCHNIAKIETHVVGGETREVCVHRKGATRAFGPGHPDIPADYRKVGQPVLIPGDMGRYSYVLAGTAQAHEETFGSTCHGAGRLLSRHQAKKAARGRSVEKELESKGILVRGASRGTIVEEIPDAYKDVADVVRVVDGAGISRKVVRLKPIGVIKG